VGLDIGRRSGRCVAVIQHITVSAGAELRPTTHAHAIGGAHRTSATGARWTRRSCLGGGSDSALGVICHAVVLVNGFTPWGRHISSFCTPSRRRRPRAAACTATTTTTTNVLEKTEKTVVRRTACRRLSASVRVLRVLDRRDVLELTRYCPGLCNGANRLWLAVPAHHAVQGAVVGPRHLAQVADRCVVGQLIPPSLLEELFLFCVDVTVVIAIVGRV